RLVLHAPALELRADELRGAVLLEALLGILMDGAPERDQLLDVGSDVGGDVHGRHDIEPSIFAQESAPVPKRGDPLCEKPPDLTPPGGPIYTGHMSGHSHWATIKHKKGAADARRGK